MSALDFLAYLSKGGQASKTWRAQYSQPSLSTQKQN